MDLLALFSVAADLAELGVFEDGGVELGRLLGLRIEPQARRDSVCCHRHDLLLSRLLVCFAGVRYARL